MPNKYAAAQIHRTTGNLMRGGFVKNQPAWYKPVLAHPPSAILPRAYPQSMDNESQDHATLKSKTLRTPKPRPQPIVMMPYDRIRRRFYRDYPFELFRPMSLIENGSSIKKVSGEGVVQRTVELMENKGMTENQAYKIACEEFCFARAREQARARSAADEATAYGFHFHPSPVSVGLKLENEALQTWSVINEDSTALLSRQAALAAVRRKEQEKSAAANS